MPGSDWPTATDEGSAGAARGSDALGPSDAGVAMRVAMQKARTLLRDTHEATARLGDAFVGAGLPPAAWRTSEALLSALSDQLPDATVATLLARLGEFSAGAGPDWLSGDGGALDDFEHEARALADVIRPLRALARRQQKVPGRARGQGSLERVLGDVRVGAEMDRLVHALCAVTVLAPLLAPLPPGASPNGAAYMHAGGSLLAMTGGEAPPARVDLWTGQPAPGLAAPAAMGSGPPYVAAEDTPAQIPIEGGADPDDPTYLLTGELPDAHPDAPTVPFDPPPRRLAGWVLGQRPRTWLTLLLTAVALLVGTALLTLAAGGYLPSLNPWGQATLTSAQATAAGLLARAATATHQAAKLPSVGRATATPVPAAHLVVAPTTIVLTCTGPGATLAVQNTGGQILTWQATAPGNVILSLRQGTLDPGGAVAIAARAVALQRGSRTIRFTSNGGSVGVSYRVSCH
jgi:hypothetical protein